MLFHPVEPPLMRSPDPGRSAARDSDPPDSFPTEADLDEFLTRPRPVLVEFMRTLAGPLVVLGAGGKMGPTLAVLARRAAEVLPASQRAMAGDVADDPGMPRDLFDGLGHLAAQHRDPGALPRGQRGGAVRQSAARRC